MMWFDSARIVNRKDGKFERDDKTLHDSLKWFAVANHEVSKDLSFQKTQNIKPRSITSAQHKKQFAGCAER